MTGLQTHEAPTTYVHTYSSGGVTASYRIDRGLIPSKYRAFLFATTSRPSTGISQHRIRLVSWARYSRLERPERVPDHSPPSSSVGRLHCVVVDA
jgi:hypothetical protein